MGLSILPYNKEFVNINYINPFLRFAREVSFQPIDDYTCAGDYHFYYILSECCILDIEGTEYCVDNGTVVLMPPELKYSFKTNTKIEAISINFDYTQNHFEKTEWIIPVRANEFDPNTVTEKIVFCDEYSVLNKPLVLNNMHHIKKNLDIILQEYVYKKQYYTEVTSGMFKTVLLEVLRDALYTGDKNESIDKILDYIHQNYYENITNQTLSAISGYHPYHLNRLMKQFTGTTLHQYLIDYRIETAKSLLRQTNLPISTVALKCGYNNFSNFSFDFKRKTSLTPSVFRKQTQHLL